MSSRGFWLSLCNERQLWRAALQYLQTGRNDICGWLLHCKNFLVMFAGIFVSTVVCPACLRGGIAATGPDEFRERGSNRLIDL